jgi:hypothetical protein
LIPETTQENLATAPDSANIDRFQARHRQQLCLGRQPAAATHIIRCFPKETLKNSASSILDLGKSKTYIAPSVYFPIFSVSP